MISKIMGQIEVYKHTSGAGMMHNYCTTLYFTVSPFEWFIMQYSRDLTWAFLAKISC